MKRKIISLLLALVMVLCLVPTMAMAAGSSVAVYVTVSNRGAIATATDGTLMAQVKVTVPDADLDGIVTVDDVLTAAHNQYCAGGYAAPGGWVSKLWGTDAFNTLFFVNDKGITTGVNGATMTTGDYLTASVNADDTYYADWYSCFQSHEIVAAAGTPVTLTLTGYQGMSGGAAIAVSDAAVGTISAEATFTSFGITDADGNVSLTFPAAGTYYVTANGRVSDTVTTDWSTYATATVLCPLIAPVCKVIVKDAPTDNDYISADKNNLTCPVLSGNKYVLSTESANGCTITWKSGNIAVVADDGTVTPPKADSYVTLTASIQHGTKKANKGFTFYVAGTPTPCTDLDSIYQAAAAYLSSTPAKYGSEWTVLDLCRSGLSVPADYYADYYADVVKTVKDKSGNLGANTNYAKLILTLSAMNKSVTDVGGYNLLEKLCRKSSITAINAADFALMALDCRSYAETGDVTRAWLKQTILDAQLTDGGWAYSGTVGDPDMTAMTLQALRPYVGEQAVKTAVDKALIFLKNAQTSTGGYSSWGNINSCSDAQVVLALAELRQDMKTEYTKEIGGKTVTLPDVLTSYYVGNGRFGYTDGTKANAAATEQVFRALVGYYRVQSGKTAYFNMSDVGSYGGYSGGASSAKTVVTSAKTGDMGAVLYLAMGAVSAVGSAAWVCRRKEEL